MLHLLTMPVPIYLALASAAHALLFYRREQERAVGLARAKLDALRMQLQPHFLFNAMNSIAELTHRDVEAAEKMLTNLSDLLRLTLETSGEHELPLRRELQFVESYLAVEHARFGERLRFQFDVADDTLAAMVPAFLLQPLVENAVRHGLAPRNAPGLIVVAARKLGKVLHLSVSDDGVGLPAEKPSRVGIGLANTHARLRELYGSEAKIEIRSVQGVTIDIHLPFRTAA
jgi:LytS/YehU family sensor histidine kinase